MQRWEIVPIFLIWSEKFTYFSSIILDAQKHLLCSKLCWHNLPGPTFQHWSHYNVESVYYLNWFLSNFGSVLVYIWQTPLSLCIVAKQTYSLRAAVWIASTSSPAIWNNRVTISIASNQAPPPITRGGTWFEAKIVTCHWVMIIEGVRTRVAFLASCVTNEDMNCFNFSPFWEKNY